MLFDLRGRGRRTTVRTVYLALAVLMGGGLILFGVGTGVGGGGLLNAFGGGGSGNSQPVVSQAVKTAQAATRQRPSDPQAWSQLVQAYDAAAKQEYNPNSQTFTATGKQDLSSETQAFERYVQLTKHPDSTVAILAARAYAVLGNYAGAAKAWQVETSADPSQAKGYECLAVNAYAAKQTRLGDLALNKALSLAPKLQRPLLKEQIQGAKTNPQVAQGC
jgi:predicted Zn-dependent protease